MADLIGHLIIKTGGPEWVARFRFEAKANGVPYKLLAEKTKNHRNTLYRYLKAVNSPEKKENQKILKNLLILKIVSKRVYFINESKFQFLLYII